jgi:hypothetical protein
VPLDEDALTAFARKHADGDESEKCVIVVCRGGIRSGRQSAGLSCMIAINLRHFANAILTIYSRLDLALYCVTNSTTIFLTPLLPYGN